MSIWVLLLGWLQFYTPSPLVQRSAETLAEGTWISCPDDSDDGYGERALAFQTNHGKIPWFEIHYGPRDQFAIFRGNLKEHIPHDDPRNLLKPAYHFNDLATVAGGRNWSIASLGITLNVVRLDGSHSDCYSFFTKVERETRPTWVQR